MFDIDNRDSLRQRSPFARMKSRRNEIFGRSSASDRFELTDDDRNSLLKEIGGKTIGSLYKFANVLDLPVSSVRDVLAGENPFDQWLSPTSDDNRVQMRELMRKHGIISRRNTWGNLAGSIAADIALDPLTYVTFGIGSGATALTKHGKLLKAAGVLDQLPSYANKLERGTFDEFLKHAKFAKQGDRLAGVPFAGQKAPLAGGRKVGQREAMQRVKHADDIINAIDDPLKKQFLRDSVEAQAKRFGYEGYDDFLAKEGQQGLKSLFRWGLPDWKILGADPTDKLRQTPHFLVGEAGSETMKKIARAQDVVGDAVFHNKVTDPLSRATASLLDYTKAGTMTRTGQRLTKAYHSLQELGQTVAGQRMSDATQHYDIMTEGGWTRMTRETDPEIINKQHDEVRELLEEYNGADPKKKAFIDRTMGYFENNIKRLKERGVFVHDMEDDELIRYAPRKLLEMLREETQKGVSTIDFDASEKLASRVFNEHMIGRAGLLTDLPGGTTTVNKITRDPAIWKIIKSSASKADKKRDIAKILRQKYQLPEGYRGKELNRPKPGDIQAQQKGMPPEETMKLGEIWKEETFADIVNDPKLSEVDKIKQVQQKLAKEYKVRMSPKWAEEAVLRKGAKVLKTDRVFKLEGKRPEAMADFLLGMSAYGDDLEKFGLFGNNPMWDMERYLQLTEDSINRADFVFDMLSTPGSIVRNVHEGQHGPTVRRMLEELGFEADVAGERLRAMLDDDIPLDNLLNLPVEKGIAGDLGRYDRYFQAPESAQFFGKIMDSALAAFKANVTAPFPAFHMRNLLSGQFRNAVANSWSVQSVQDSWKVMHGKDIEGAENIPYLKQRWERLRGQLGDPALATAELDNKRANQLLRQILGEGNLIGPYGGKGKGVLGDVQNIGATQLGDLSTAAKIRSLAHGMEARLPGGYGFSEMDAARRYFGRPVSTKKVKQADGSFKDVPVYETEFGLPQVIGFHPINAIQRLLAKAGVVKGERAANWMQKEIFGMPNVLKTRGMHEWGGFKKDAKLIHETGEEVLDYGPIAGGMAVGHLVEGMNRIAPALHKLRNGVDPAVAFREVIAQQVPYGAKYYTPFENTYLKRLFPFYSFTSRSLPWALRKFIEQPGNKLNQLIRGTTGVGEHLQEKHQGLGPVPPHLRDTLAIPLPYKGLVEGTKRFFTGADVMSQDLWQILMPLMSGEFSDFGYEIAGRANPFMVKLPVEKITGTSLFQRGVEGGRPLRTMDPPLGRMLENISRTWARATGEDVPADYYKRLAKDSTLEHLLASSWLSRYIGTTKTAFDPRKGLLAKGARLGLGAGVTDVSPQAQESILREYLRGMIHEAGGSIFEKATFTKEQMANMTEEELQAALKLKALMDERAKVAKLLKEKAQVK